MNNYINKIGECTSNFKKFPNIIGLVEKNKNFIVYFTDSNSKSYIIYKTCNLDELNRFLKYLFEHKNYKNKLFNSYIGNHPIDYGNDRIYRLRYLSFNVMHRGVPFNIDQKYKTFYLPNDLNEIELFKYLSYQKDSLKCEDSSFTAEYLDTMIPFDRVETDNNQIVDLFVLGNDKRCIKKYKNLYNSYFDWYINDINENDLNKINNKEILLKLSK